MAIKARSKNISIEKGLERKRLIEQGWKQAPANERTVTNSPYKPKKRSDEEILRTAFADKRKENKSTPSKKYDDTSVYNQNLQNAIRRPGSAGGLDTSLAKPGKKKMEKLTNRH